MYVMYVPMYTCIGIRFCLGDESKLLLDSYFVHCQSNAVITKKNDNGMMPEYDREKDRAK